MKLLSDFDGVWTHPAAEAVAQGEYLDGTLADWVPAEEREGVVSWLRRAREETQRDPRRWGWLSEGRVSAFADEDPFMPHSAVLHYLHEHQSRDATARSLAAAVRDHGFDGFDAFGGHSHARGVEQVVRSRGPGILSVAAAAGRRMLEADLEVVVVSNSTPDKLLDWFDHARVPRTRHPERAAGALRVRGSARKFVLGPPVREPLRLGDVAIDVDRPSYEAILLDEHPDAVVGDVLSLDLALPLMLRREAPEWSGTRLLWLIHPYTPAWLRDLAREHAPEIEPVEGGLAAVADRLLAGTRGDQPPRS